MTEQTGRCSRRGFLAAMAAAGAASFVKPAGGFGFAAPDRIKLGFDNFSIRAFNWKAPRLIEYAGALKVDTLLLSDLDVYESLDEDYLGKLRAQAERAGVELQAGTGSICPTSNSYSEAKWGKAEDHARLLIRTARRLGSPVARCYLGSRRDREDGVGIARHIDQMVKVLKAVRSEAEDSNVKIAVENHAGDMQAWELVNLIEAAGKDFVGATVDPGNATWTMEDPLVNLEILGPYALTTGIRDTAVWETDNGAMCMWTNMGRGVVDWEAYTKRFRELCPRTPFVLEIISYKWSNEVQFLKPEFWSKYPGVRADEFARFIALAKRGKPFELPPERPAGEASEQLEQAQQKFDLEASLEYCRRVLGLGVNG
ncbi:MAG: sugar phosphate isomerase/epimerase [Planctomycetes bacterium]|nr:sugar phosphate isomerase/epimerase [Planctomycetota bacterium]